MTTLTEMAELIQYSRDSRDESDRASASEAATVIGGVAAVLGRMQGQGADHCEDCGLMIPHARRKAAPWAVRCVDCQGIRERRA